MSELKWQQSVESIWNIYHEHSCFFSETCIFESMWMICWVQWAHMAVWPKSRPFCLGLRLALRTQSPTALDAVLSSRLCRTQPRSDYAEAFSGEVQEKDDKTRQGTCQKEQAYQEGDDYQTC
jgi:hypothetical protein